VFLVKKVLVRLFFETITGGYGNFRQKFGDYTEVYCASEKN
jgi:hypothetical protein